MTSLSQGYQVNEVEKLAKCKINGAFVQVLVVALALTASTELARAYPDYQMKKGGSVSEWGHQGVAFINETTRVSI